MQFSSGMDRSCSAHSGPVQHDIGKFTATQFFAIARRPKLGVFHSVRILDCTCRLLSAVTPLRVASSTQSNRSFSKCAAGTGMDCGTSSAASVRAAAACSSRTGSQALPECYVIVYNVAKKHNVGTLLRSCTAFGVKEVCLVGSRQYNTFGSHGSDVHVQLRHFPVIEACCSYLKEAAGCQIVGVEIDPSAKPVQQYPFTGNTAFMLGNEGQGLSKKQMSLCDSFVYIPQHGAGTASLNVTVAASIVLHQFAVWAQYPERQREGAKYAVDSNKQRIATRGVVPPSAEERQLLIQQRKAAADGADDWLLKQMQQHGGLDELLEAVADGVDCKQ